MPPVLDDRLAERLWRPYVDDIRSACASMAIPEDVGLVAAIWARETIFGTCPDYEPKGPNGRGDGGHGRGLGQIDDRGPFRYLIPPDGTDWPPFIQAQATCAVLASAREELEEFRGALSSGAWDEAVACRYNALLTNIQWSLRNGRDPNVMTTPGPLAKVNPATGKPIGDYGRDVLRLRDQLREFFPETFPPAAGPAAT